MANNQKQSITKEMCWLFGTSISSWGSYKYIHSDSKKTELHNDSDDMQNLRSYHSTNEIISL